MKTNEELADAARMVPTDIAELLISKSWASQRYVLTLFAAQLDYWTEQNFHLDPIAFDVAVRPGLVASIAAADVLTEVMGMTG